MPDRITKFLLGYPAGFWLAVVAVALVQARIRQMTVRQALASVATAIVLAATFVQGIIVHWHLSPSPFVTAALGGAFAIGGEQTIRVISSIGSVKDLAAAAGELLRAWRGK